MPPRAELTLYFGRCSKGDIAVSDGQFASGYTNPFMSQTEVQALAVVNEHIDLKPDEIIVPHGYGYLVQNETEARHLVEYFTRLNMGVPFIQLEDFFKGRIGFHRKVIFEGWEEGERENMLTIFRQSDYHPNLDGVLDLDYRDQPALVEKKEKELWDLNLKFFDG